MERKLDLLIGVEVPICAHIGRTIVHHHITLEMLQLFLDKTDTFFGGNIALETDTALDWLDRIQIDANFD